MGFDLARIQRELAEHPLSSPVPLDLAIAIVNDVLRVAGTVVVVDRGWEAWRRAAKPLWEEQMGMVAHALAVTSLREATVGAIRRLGDPRPVARLQGFFGAIEPLTAEMIRSNQFRREELLRRWIEAWEGRVEGEAPEQSARRLEQLDYRRALREYERAEAARKSEAARRAKLAQEAAEREAAARGWRE